MPYAEVAVNSPFAQRMAFSYGIPDSLSLQVGQPVWVPFGAKLLQGIVLELTDYPGVEDTRDIAGIIDPSPLLSPDRIAVARWISSYYLSSLFESVALMLPPGFERRVITYISKPQDLPELPSSLNPDEKQIVEYVWQKGEVNLRELGKNWGQRLVKKKLSFLVNQRLVVKTYRIEKIKIKPRMVSCIRLKAGIDQAEKILAGLGSRSAKQAGLLRYLIDNPGGAVAVSQLKRLVDYSPQSVKALAAKDLIEVQKVRSERDPLAASNINLSFPLTLTPAQQEAFKAISDSLHRKSEIRNSKTETPNPEFEKGLNDEKITAKAEVFLLYGVTGSGKTEVYLQALKEAIALGKKGVVLVPEIAMTPQIIERFVSRFPGRVAVLHSELSLGEQFDEWWRIKAGEFDVVIGPRSAIFAPQPDLGLIIIDEEHEWTYKQADNSPRYHTREVASKLAELSGATVVLGSATPDVESYFRALNGHYSLLRLPERVTRGEATPLPEVEVTDLRRELKEGNLSIFSRTLANSIKEALQNKQQVILFLNRRGTASFVECRNCGYVICCKRCEIPLSYHFKEQILLCHQCNYRTEVPQICPRCHSNRIKYIGAGTEKLEQETALAFPEARLLRWDSDVTRGHSHMHQEIFSRFKSGQADILLGTQMIAKGLDLPGVTLVGVVNADVALNLPDFRAGERTFQLLSQVAGRAGRGAAAGKVIIQTYSPEHYAVQAAAKHDFVTFYEKEISYRRELNNPPFSRLACLVFAHSSENRCREETEKMKQVLLNEKNARGAGDVGLVGPAPAFMHKLRGRYRWQIILRASNPSAFLTEIDFPKGWSIDIDPVGIT